MGSPPALSIRCRTASSLRATSSLAKEGGDVEIVVSQVQLFPRTTGGVGEDVHRLRRREDRRRQVGGPRRRYGAFLPALEPGGNDGDPYLVAHVVVDHGAEDDVGVGMCDAVDDLGGLVHLESPRSEPPAMLSTMPRAPSMEASSSGDVMAALAALAARPSPMEEPMPMMAVPALVMTIFTSAKSVLMRPGTVMRSVMPRTPWSRTSSAILKAFSMLVLSLETVSSRSFGMTISVSTFSLRI